MKVNVTEKAQHFTQIYRKNAAIRNCKRQSIQLRYSSVLNKNQAKACTTPVVYSAIGVLWIYSMHLLYGSSATLHCINLPAYKCRRVIERSKVVENN